MLSYYRDGCSCAWVRSQCHHLCNVALVTSYSSRNRIRRRRLVLKSCSEVGSKVPAFPSHLVVIGVAFPNKITFVVKTVFIILASKFLQVAVNNQVRASDHTANWLRYIGGCTSYTGTSSWVSCVAVGLNHLRHHCKFLQKFYASSTTVWADTFLLGSDHVHIRSTTHFLI